jgi:hypothetical protein
MKTSLVYRFLVAGTMVMLPWLTGCAQSTASNPPVAAITTSTPVAPPPTIVAPTATTSAPAFKPVPVGQPLIVIGPTNATTTNEVAAVIAPPAEIVVPANLRVSRALGDIIQLVQSGVEEAIILTYITNSPAAFLLGAEEIVYLKDLGVSSPVITSMMQRDQTLKQQWGLAGLPATSPIATNEEPIAVAPTYASEPAPVVEPQPAEVTDDYFYDTLSPYGTWVNVDGYGRCWQPTVVIGRPAWRPYCDNGRWVYSDSGWYWASGYSWGSVAFHYGRWFSHPSYGWCWWPNKVWAPSWVSWRYDNSYCGWAPLPPNSIYTPGVGLTYFGASVGVSFGFQLGVGSYTYVPWGRVCDPYPYRHCVPQTQVVAVHGNTTPANQFVRGSNNRVENRGIAPERYQEHARTELRTVKIREEVARGAGPRPERFEGNGNTLVVSRPTAMPPATENRITGTRNSSSTRTINTSRSNEPRRSERPAPIIVNGSTTRTATPASAARVEPATGAERSSRSQESINSRTWNNATTTGRPPGRTTPVPTTSPTPVTRPTPIFSKPLVVESSPQISSRPNQATPATSTTVIGGGRSSGSSGRDYSVWSSPTPRPAATPNPGNSPRSNSSPGRNAGGTEYTAPTAGNPATPDLGRSRETGRSQEVLAERSQQMNSRSRSEPRSASPNYTAPSPRAVGPSPAANPSPTVNATPRPTYSAPTPAPSTPNAVQTSPPARVESRPSPSQNSSSDAGRGSRNR